MDDEAARKLAWRAQRIAQAIVREHNGSVDEFVEAAKRITRARAAWSALAKHYGMEG